MWRMLSLAALALLPSAQALARGDEGHRIVCEIAYREAAPATQDAIKALIATDGHFTTFADACTWPDHPASAPTSISSTCCGTRLGSPTMRARRPVGTW